MLVSFLSRSWARGSSLCQSRAEMPKGAAACVHRPMPCERPGHWGHRRTRGRRVILELTGPSLQILTPSFSVVPVSGRAGKNRLLPYLKNEDRRLHLRAASCVSWAGRSMSGLHQKESRIITDPRAVGHRRDGAMVGKPSGIQPGSLSAPPAPFLSADYFILLPSQTSTFYLSATCGKSWVSCGELS